MILRRPRTGRAGSMRRSHQKDDTAGLHAIIFFPCWGLAGATAAAMMRRLVCVCALGGRPRQSHSAHCTRERASERQTALLLVHQSRLTTACGLME